MDKKESELLKQVYGQNLAERIADMPMTDKTKAALYYLGKVQDTKSVLFALHKLVRQDLPLDVRQAYVKFFEPIESLGYDLLREGVEQNILEQISEV